MNRFFCTAAFTSLLVFNVIAQQNLVADGDFADSTLKSWSFSANGAQATAAYDPSSGGRLIVDLIKSGNTESAPQLRQSTLQLEAGEGYTLSFKMTSTKAMSVRAVVASRNNGAYSDSAAGKINLLGDAKLKAYSIDFFVDTYFGDARLDFNLGNSGKDSVKILLDSVFIVKKTEPTIRVVTPGAEDRWVAGTERQIIWKNSGTLDKVQIKFSKDSGSSWVSIAAAANNANSFWWKVPSDATGNKCKIIISDLSGKIADTSDAFKIIASGNIASGELVKNGDFLDTTHWRFSVNGGAKAKGTFVDDKYQIQIDSVSTENWMVKLEQPGLTLQSGKMYFFSFDAWASHDRIIYANVGGENGSPSYAIYGGDTIEIQLKPEISHTNVTFVMSYPTSSNIRVEFNCGNDTGKVYIDNVSLIEMDAPDVLVSKPSIGSFLKSGTKFTIRWESIEDVSKVTLQYSIDNAKSWKDVVVGIENLGAFEWDVPNASSEKCFIRIVNTENDSDLGRSSVFQINKFGTSIKTGDLITNGSFSSNLQGWTTSFNGGAAGKGIVSKKGVFGVEINEPGAAMNNIILSQGNLMVLAGKEYTLSFSTFANGTRDMAVRVVAEDTVILIDSAFTVPTLMDTVEFKFTPASDFFAKVEFFIGGSRAGVYIDDIRFGTNLPLAVSSKFVMTNPLNSFQIKNFAGNYSFDVGMNVKGRIGIFNLNGSMVCMIPVSEKVLWNGKDSHGSSVARGTYIAAFKNETMKMVQKFQIR